MHIARSLIVTFIISACLVLNVAGQEYDKADLKRKKEDLLDEVYTLRSKVKNLDNKLKESETQLDRCKSVIPDTVTAINNAAKQECDERFARNAKPLGSLNGTVISKQVWATRHLLEDEVKKLIPDIQLAQSALDWDRVYNQHRPAYCYHEFDTAHSYGVLLNLPALILLQDTLSANPEIGWRIPEQKDIQQLESAIKQIKNNSLSIIELLGRPPQPTGINWGIKAIDFFGLNMQPISYRRNNEKEWFGQTEYCFYCFNNRDSRIKESIILAFLSEDYKDEFSVWTKSVNTEAGGNFGVYVRLIKK